MCSAAAFFCPVTCAISGEEKLGNETFTQGYQKDEEGLNYTAIEHILEGFVLTMILVVFLVVGSRSSLVFLSQIKTLAICIIALAPYRLTLLFQMHPSS